VATEHKQPETAFFARRLGLGQRICLAIACELWICANIFPRRSDLGFCIVSVVQLIAVVLIFLRLRRSPAAPHFRIRSGILLVVLFITGIDLFTAFWQLSGHNFPVGIANLGPIELVAALVGVIYCFYTKPTRLMLLLYTITFVAAVHAVALTLAFAGALAGTPPSADFSPFLTMAKMLSIFEVAVSVIYPIYFILKGRYARQLATHSEVTN
jgi:hypothetical protein